MTIAEELTQLEADLKAAQEHRQQVIAALEQNTAQIQQLAGAITFAKKIIAAQPEAKTPEPEAQKPEAVEVAPVKP